MPRLAIPLATLAALLPLIGAASALGGPAGLLRVDADAVWTGLDIEAPAGLVVASGATLELRGTDLHVAGAIVVERGATLRLGPSGDRPTRILPLNATQGFWIDAQGHLASRGEPRTLIEGLSGHGLESVVQLPGGIKINATAELRDVWIRNGTAGLIVRPAAHLVMADARFERLFLMGAAIMGPATFDRVEAVDNIIGITGRGRACHVAIRNSSLANWGGNLQMVGCAATIEDTLLDRADTNLVGGGADYLFRNVLVKGYLNAGIRAEEGARVSLDNVTVLGGRRGELGIDLQLRNHLVARAVHVEGNTGDGIRIQSGEADLDGVRSLGNGGHGLALVSSPVPNLAGADFTGTDPSSWNAGGAVGVYRQFTATATAVNGTPAKRISLTITDTAGRTVFDGWLPGSTMTATFDTYANGTGGASVPAGPFRYHVESDVLPQAAQGDVDLESPLVFLRPQEAGTEGGRTAWAMRSAALLAAGVLLVVARVVRVRQKAAKAKNGPADGPQGPA